MVGRANIGLIGLAVMGQNLVLNMVDHGFKVAVFNRTTSKVDQFLQENSEKRDRLIGAYCLEEFVSLLSHPRKIIIMICAGDAVDQTINTLLPFLERGDIIIDGGNSYYLDSERRCKFLEGSDTLFLGMGVSGGEEGARHGPSIMPGGDRRAWPVIKPILQAICAKSKEGDLCCDWVGEGGAGHYVKMIHNGIEYVDMQIICEAYQLLNSRLKLSKEKIAQIFEEWNRGELGGYLVEITGHILRYKESGEAPLVESILDVAQQKGTGKWAGINALELNVPATLIGEAVFARYLSAHKTQRRAMSKCFAGRESLFQGNAEELIRDTHQALYASKIINYTQGFMLMQATAKKMGWELDYSAIALMWRGGCIIRSHLLKEIKRAFDKNHTLENLLFDPFFKEEIVKSEGGWRRVVSHVVTSGIPAPCFCAALSFFDGYRSEKLPMNLIQAQRDLFGAHTYERTDQPRGKYFHTNWGYSDSGENSSPCN